MNIFKTIYEETIKQLFYRIECNNSKLHTNEPSDNSIGENNVAYKNKNMFNKFSYILNELLSVKDKGIHIKFTDNKISFSYIEDNVIELSIYFIYCKENNTVNSSIIAYYTMTHSTIFSTSGVNYLDDLSLEEWNIYHTKLMTMRDKYIEKKHDIELLNVKDILNISRNEKLSEMQGILNTFNDEKEE